MGLAMGLPVSLLGVAAVEVGIVLVWGDATMEMVVS